MRPWLIALVCLVSFLSGGMCAAAAQQTTSSAQVVVSGEVQRPGPVDWTPQMTVAQALAAVGGVTERASQTITVTRHQGNVAVSRSGVPATFTVQAGDRIDVRPTPYTGIGPHLTVRGEVKNPGEYTVGSGPGMLSRAIAAAGGYSAEAGSDVQVRRVWQGRPGSSAITTATADPSTITIDHMSRRSIEGGRAEPFLTPDGATVLVTAASPAPASDALGRVTITGDVARPTSLPLAGLTIRAAIDGAGGLNPTAIKLVTIIRASGTSRREYVSYSDIVDGSIDIPLHDGDAINVPISTFVTLRDARRPGARASTSWSNAAGRTVQKCLDSFNRPNPFDALRGTLPVSVDQVQVQREVDHQIQNLTPTPDFVLQGNDVIVVVR
jgi:protein involved in polysaccharide export with SLBB domain